MTDRFWSKVDTSAGPDACWPWLAAKDSRGYGRFSTGGRSGGMVLAHRYALSVTDPGVHVLHSCDNPSCVNPAHLRMGNHALNMRDMAARERARTPRLTAVQVSQIRRLAASGVTYLRLAHQFGVSKSNIQAIAARKTWRHVA